MINFRRGIVLYTLLGVLVVVSIFVFAIDTYTRKKLKQTQHLHERYTNMVLAQSVINYSVARLQEQLETADGKLLAFFSSSELTPGTSIPIELPDLKKILEEFPKTNADVSLEVSTIKQLKTKEDLNKTGFDPFEKTLTLNITALVAGQQSECTLREQRELKLVNLMPDILGKFTLYVKESGDSDSLNRFANHIDGYADSQFSLADSCRPVILKNGGELDFAASEADDPDSWRTRGFIYLGGSEVNLNLTSGNFEGYGELFHFYSLSQSPGIPGYFDIDSPAFFAVPPDFSKAWPQSLNPGPPFAPRFAYFLKHVITGFYTTQDNGSDMSHDGRLGISFPANDKNARVAMRSSSLNLYGTSANPSPTLVLGKVNRRYADFTGIVVDVDGDGSRDAVVDYVRETDQALGTIANPPGQISTIGNGSVQPGLHVKLNNGLVNYSNMFATELSYADNMCKLKTEPYLRSMDFMYFRGDDEFFPSQAMFGESDSSWQSSFSLKFHHNLLPDHSYYQNGNPQNFPAARLTDKTVFAVKDEQEFYRHFIKADGKTLALGVPVSVINKADETFKLPSNLSIARGGVIFIEDGHLELGSISRDDPDEVLTIIVNNGNILLNLPAQSPVYANLIALNGTLLNLNNNHGIDLHGSLIVKNYDPGQFKVGGRLNYDPRNDPSGFYYKNYFRCYIADFAKSFSKTF